MTTDHDFELITLVDRHHNQVGKFSTNPLFAGSTTGVVLYRGESYSRRAASIYQRCDAWVYDPDTHADDSDGDRLSLISRETVRLRVANHKRSTIARWRDRWFISTDWINYYETASWTVDDTNPAVTPAIAAADADDLDRIDSIENILDDFRTFLRDIRGDISDRLDAMREDLSVINDRFDDLENLEVVFETTQAKFDDKQVGRIDIARSPLYHVRYSIAKFAFSLAAGAGIATAVLLTAGDRDQVILPGMILAGSVAVGSWVKP